MFTCVYQIDFVVNSSTFCRIFAVKIDNNDDELLAFLNQLVSIIGHKHLYLFLFNKIFFFVFFDLLFCKIIETEKRQYYGKQINCQRK